MNDNQINSISLQEAEYKNVFKKRLSKDKSLYQSDLFIISLLNRQLSLCSGFKEMNNSKNYVCAVPLLRLNIDSLLRLHALWICDDPNEVIKEMLDGKILNQIKDKNGKKLSDAYLLDRLSEHEPWVKTVYKNCSGFVHFSEKHLGISVSTEGEDIGHFTARISSEQQHIPKEIWEELSDAFIHVNKIIIEYVNKIR